MMNTVFIPSLMTVKLSIVKVFSYIAYERSHKGTLSVLHLPKLVKLHMSIVITSLLTT